MTRKWIKTTEGEGWITGDSECWCIQKDLGNDVDNRLKELQKIWLDMSLPVEERLEAYEEYGEIKPWEGLLYPHNFEPEDYQDYAEDFRANMENPEWDDDWPRRSVPKVRFKIIFEIEALE